MPAKNDTEALYAQIKRRLVESGEWDRIQLTMTNKLNESGWMDTLSHRSKEKARTMDPLSFRNLLTEISFNVEAGIPLAVRKEIMTVIRQHAEKQFE